MAQEIRKTVTPPATHSSIHQSKAQAAQLLEQGSIAAAYAAYGKLLRAEPQDDLINLGYARAALRHGKAGQAVMAYERLLAKYPTEPVLLQELATALQQQNDGQRAVMELAKDTSGSSTQHADITEQWKKKNQRLQVSGKLRAGMLYDSNVNTGPASNEISLGRRDFALSDAKAQESFGAYVGGSVDLAYRLSPESSWWLVGSGNTLLRYNAHQDLYDLGLSSSEWLRGTAGVRYLTDSVLWEIRAEAEVFDYGFEQNVVALGPESTLVYALSPKVHLITKANISGRMYSNNEGYNGWYGSAGQYVRFFFGGKGTHVTLGGRYMGAAADQARYSYDGFEASLKFSFMLPYYDISIAPFISYGGEYFHAPATTHEDEFRRDYRLATGLSVTIPIHDAWSVELGYQYVKNTSTSELYEYDQHVTNLGIVWSF